MQQNNEKAYEKPKMDVLRWGDEDVITASGVDPDNPGPSPFPTDLDL